MKKLLLVFALIALTVVACGGGKTTVTPPPSNPNGAILFSDDFSKNSSGWDIAEDENAKVGYDGGEYVMTVLNTAWDTWANPGTKIFESNVVVDVDARHVSGPEDALLGVICGYESVENFSVLALDLQGSALIYRYTNGEYQELASQALPAPINPDTNHLTAYCQPEQLTLYINGTQVLSAKDDYFRAAGVGLLTGSFNEPNVEAAYDNFLVTELN